MKTVCFALLMVFLPAVCFGQAGITRVDFKNFTYPAFCASDEVANVTVKDGEFSSEKQEDGYVDRFLFKVLDVAYGDLNSDRRDEAIILTVCNTGGTGNFSEGFIYTLRSGSPVLLARIPGGDRADGGLRNAFVEDGLLVVDSNDPGEDGGACCPQVIVTTKYRLSGDRIAKVGNETRRPVFPTERISFKRGASGKIFKTTIAADQGKRFVVAARAGQTLTVSIDTDKASLRLLEEVETKFGINTFLVRVPKTGDYTVELQNNSDAPLPVTVNIKIR
ncbi:MAG: hypothetical protein H0U23_11355 [Blastocatellia bacterium]|nr:hypothetical protein [Blastocatellia bacterium]